MKRRILLMAVASATSVAVFSQDIHFSQINEVPLMLNPAAAGTCGSYRAIVNYRDQWRSITAPYRTYDLSFDWLMKSKSWKNSALGGGIVLFNDMAGTSKMGTLQASLNLSGMINVDDKNSMSAGLAAGFAQKSYNAGSLKWDSQYNGQSYDPSLPSNELFGSDNFSYADFSGGIQWLYGKGERYITANDEVKANLGVAMFHFNQPEQVYAAIKDKLYSKFTVNGGMGIGIKNTPLSLAPSFLLAFQGPDKEMIFGSMIKYKLREDSKYTGFKKGASMSLGGYYRTGDAFIGVVQLEISQFSLGFSYDLNTSDLRAASGGKGGFEISLRMLSANPYIYKASSSF